MSSSDKAFINDWFRSISEGKRAKKEDIDARVTTTLKYTTLLLIFAEITLLILFASVGGSSLIDSESPSGGDGTQGYNMFIGVEIMMFIGFGYLMTFLKWYGLGAVGFTMLITAIGLQWDLFTQWFFTCAWAAHWEYVKFDIYRLLDALYAISSVLISFGALIGKINPLQLLVLTLVEILLHSVNLKILMEGVLNVADVGGTYSDHMFGAYFGLAVAYQLGRPKAEPEMGNTADILSLIGTLFLWVYWPSFVAGAAGANSIQQQRAIVNTILALSASTVAAFSTSALLNEHWRFRPVDIQNATLAGGVAIGCTANLTMSAFGGIMIGIAAGIISTIGYNYIQPLLESHGLHDTCGIHNLHAMPSVVGALASVILAGYKESNHNHDSVIYGATSKGQWWHQLVGIILCVSFAISTGSLIGYLLKKYFSIVDSDHLEFQDECWWHVAEDYGESIYNELGKFAVHIDQSSKERVENYMREHTGHTGRRNEKSATDILASSHHSRHLSSSQHSRSGYNLTSSNHSREENVVTNSLSDSQHLMELAKLKLNPEHR